MAIVAGILLALATLVTLIVVELLTAARHVGGADAMGLVTVFPLLGTRWLALAGGLDRAARHVTQRLALTVVARSPIERVVASAETPDGIHHFWSAELLYVPGPGHPRHVDLLWPIWSLFDLTPEGRGDWMPKLCYEP
jgi:predicted dithiol-disulfide oxidoreductase (DUF899 family)